MPLDVFAIVLGIYLALVFTVSDEAAVAMLSRAIGIVFWCAVFCRAENRQNAQTFGTTTSNLLRDTME